MAKYITALCVYCSLFFVVFVVVGFNDAGHLCEKTDISLKIHHVFMYVRSMQLNMQR